MRGGRGLVNGEIRQAGFLCFFGPFRFESASRLAALALQILNPPKFFEAFFLRLLPTLNRNFSIFGFSTVGDASYFFSRNAPVLVWNKSHRFKLDCSIKMMAVIAACGELRPVEFCWRCPRNEG